MLDVDLAELYGVATKRLNEAVRRNGARFPEDFMFQLAAGEAEYLRSQFATSNGRGGRRYLPYAFTEQGVAMLSSVLNSKRAILVNDASRREAIDEPPTENIRRLKEIKPFIDPFSFQEMKLLLGNVDPHYGAYFTTAFLTGMRPNEMIALKWSNVDFEMRCITVRESRVLGIEGPPKTMSSYRDIDMLDPLLEALRTHREGAPAGETYVFPGKTGRPLEVNNLRKRVWYPAIAAAGLRRRTMYQTRHTFASLMLGHGEDPLWVARMLGHTGLEMIFKHYGKFIRNRSRKDGGRFLEGLKEAETFPPSGARAT